MSSLIYPNLDLFVYQLREGFGDSAATVQKNHQAFWENLPEALRNPEKSFALLVQSQNYLPAQTLAQPENLSIAERSFKREIDANRLDYCELLPLADYPQNYYSFDSIGKSDPIQGYYYPVRLEDTYGLLLDCYIENSQGKLDIQNCFSRLKGLAKSKQGNLGKTWLLSGILPEDFTGDLKELAQKAYDALDLVPRDVKEAGKFFGVPCFEVWNYPRRWESLDENIHVLILLFPNLEKAKKLGESYNQFMRLFCYRSKVLWAYYQTREIKRYLQDSYQVIFGLAKTLDHLNLMEYEKHLQNIAEILSSYALNLNYLEIQLNTLKINYYNYQQTLEDLTYTIPETQLTSLADFSKTVEQKYQAQIESDIASLSPGLRVLEDLINSIRGKVEIQQAKSDRTFQYTVETWGVGLAVTGITATSISPFIPPMRGIDPSKQTPTDATINAGLTLFISLVVGLFSTAIVKVIIPPKKD